MASVLLLILKVALLWQHCSAQEYDDPPPADIGMEEELTTKTMDQIISRALGGIDGNNNSSDGECDIWAKLGHCDINPGWMAINCTGSCSQINNGEDTYVNGKDQNVDIEDNETTTVSSTPPKCEDKNPHCKYWVADGLCANNGEVLNQCILSCNNCRKRCHDNHLFCGMWSRAGECLSNPGFMLRFCQKSCNYC